MSGYLLDTSVLSAIAPGRVEPEPVRAEWFRRENDGLYVPTVAVAEIFDGIAKLRRSGATARAGALVGWMEALIAGYGSRILPFDARAARRAGEISDMLRAAGRHPGFSDIAVAATAAVNELTVATRNVRHFEAIGIPFLDPFPDAR